MRKIEHYQILFNDSVTLTCRIIKFKKIMNMNKLLSCLSLICEIDCVKMAQDILPYYWKKIWYLFFLLPYTPLNLFVMFVFS